MGAKLGFGDSQAGKRHFIYKKDNKRLMYLFFVRAFNDIDHMTPIIWKMARNNHPVAVYCLNAEYDIEQDYRLNFLKKSGLRVDYLYNQFDQKLNALHSVLRFLTLKSYALQRWFDSMSNAPLRAVPKILRRIVHRVGLELYKVTRKKFYNNQWARYVLKQSGAKVLCFDWVRPRQYVVEVLMTAAKDLGIPTLALPHGVFIYTNDFITIESRPLETYDKLNPYDHVIVQNKLYKDVMSRTGLEKNKIRVMGSARYCSEWTQQNKKIFPQTVTPQHYPDGKLKVVFMTTKIRYRIHTERLLQTIELLARLEGVNAVVKPHTRTTKEARLYQKMPIPNLSGSSSVELCEWADVVLVIGSSIIIEPLLQGKACLYLKYLHENTTLYEDFGACWTINDEEQLQQALKILRADKNDVPYAQSGVNRFLSDIIYGGQQKTDVLKDYEQFIIHSGPGWPA
jgi:hypothetical protein